MPLNWVRLNICVSRKQSGGKKEKIEKFKYKNKEKEKEWKSLNIIETRRGGDKLQIS